MEGGDAGIRRRLRRRWAAAAAAAGTVSPPGERSGAAPAKETQLFGPGAGGCPVDLFGESFAWDCYAQRFPAPLLFVDIETCGLGDAPIFLVGMLRVDPAAADGARLRFESRLAADPSREPDLLRAVTRRLAATPRWVSFNGRSFDIPRLRKRMFRHGLVLPESDCHVDLLLEVRRRWKASLPDCRLGTVERRLLGLERDPFDIPGREVPERYWDFVTSGRVDLIAPIREHNRRDVLAMVALLHHLGEAGLRIGDDSAPA